MGTVLCGPPDRAVVLQCSTHYLQLLPLPAQPWLLPRDLPVILALPGFCRNRGLTWEMESLVPPSLKKMVSHSRRSLLVTTRGLVSTVILTRVARLSLLSTPLGSMDSEF